MELTKTKILKFIVCSLTYRFNETLLGGAETYIFTTFLIQSKLVAPPNSTKKIMYLLKILAFVATIAAKKNYYGTNYRNERIDF
jgi:hypothetical protein